MMVSGINTNEICDRQSILYAVGIIDLQKSDSIMYTSRFTKQISYQLNVTPQHSVPDVPPP
jgi:hypothetical protein